MSGHLVLVVVDGSLAEGAEVGRPGCGGFDPKLARCACLSCCTSDIAVMLAVWMTE